MTDIHTHILFGIDDGPASIEKSIDMVRAQANNGIRSIVFSPHYHPCKISVDDFAAARYEKSEQLTYSTSELNVKFILASETLYSEALLYYSNIRELCIGETDYLLLEFPYDIRADNTLLKNLSRLMDKFRVIPVIAHIERYPHIVKSSRNINNLHNIGCLTQINADYVLNPKTRPTALKLIKNSYVDLIASDCHNLSTRPPLLRNAYNIVGQTLGDNIMNSIVAASDCLVSEKAAQNIMQNTILY